MHAVLIMQIVLDKLRCEKLASKFCACAKHEEVLVALTTSVIEYNEELDTCEYGDSSQVVTSYILSIAANTLLNKLCKFENNNLTKKNAAKRKLKILQA